MRILGFVNRVDDLTDQIIGAALGSDLSGAFDDLSRMTRWHRNSDYGSVFADVVENHLDAIGHRTAVLILGDARSNHTDPQFDMLREIVGHARHVSWLNPEPARMWSSGDSVALRYSEIVDMHECRNVAQLQRVRQPPPPRLSTARLSAADSPSALKHADTLREPELIVRR